MGGYHGGEDSKPFDKFELLTALLLGLAAIGAALAALQQARIDAEKGRCRSRRAVGDQNASVSATLASLPLGFL
jgi:hypothetical protein